MKVTAKKQLGQHFLVDENILGVIGRFAELHDDDVVLEIGPGLGVLTAYLADRVAQVHAVELDASLGPRLIERLAGRPNVELRFGDALRLDLAETAPGAGKLVANLPYNIATPLIVESLDRLPDLTLWCVMVQREVADRLFAEPSTKAYGAVSVLVQLVAERRTGLPADFRRIKSTVEASFAHRRKRLANSIELAGLADRPRAEEAIAQVGKPPTVRAEELAPADFLQLADALR